MPIGLRKRKTKVHPEKVSFQGRTEISPLYGTPLFDRIVKEKPKGVMPMYVSTSEIVQKQTPSLLNAELVILSE